MLSTCRHAGSAWPLLHAHCLQHDILSSTPASCAAAVHARPGGFGACAQDQPSPQSSTCCILNAARTDLGDAALHDEEVRVVDIQRDRMEQVLDAPARNSARHYTWLIAVQAVREPMVSTRDQKQMLAAFTCAMYSKENASLGQGAHVGWATWPLIRYLFLPPMTSCIALSSVSSSPIFPLVCSMTLMRFSSCLATSGLTAAPCVMPVIGFPALLTGRYSARIYANWLKFLLTASRLLLLDQC